MLSRPKIRSADSLNTRRGKAGWRWWFEVSLKTCKRFRSHSSLTERSITIQFKLNCKTSNKRREISSREHWSDFKRQKAADGKLSASNHNEYCQKSSPRIGTALCKLCDRAKVRIDCSTTCFCVCFCDGRWNIHRIRIDAKLSKRVAKSLKFADSLRMRQNFQSDRLSLTFKRLTVNDQFNLFLIRVSISNS